MKLIALVSIIAGAAITRPGRPFEVATEDEGQHLKDREFAREPTAEELAKYWPGDTEKAAQAKADAEAEAKAKAEAEAKAKADAEAAAKEKADAAAKAAPANTAKAAPAKK